MSKERLPLGIKRRTLASSKKETTETEKAIAESNTPEPKAVAKKAAPKKGRPSTKKGKKLVKYSIDIHPELKRAVVKSAAIHDKEVHVMWNEIVFAWFEKESKKNPDWYRTIDVKKSEL